MLERLQKQDSDIEVLSVSASEFENFGRVINSVKENELNDIIRAAEKMPMRSEERR